MKQHIIKLFSFFVVVILSIACGGGSEPSDDIITSTEYLNVTNQIAIAGDGTQKGQLQISADCNWTISGAPSWMSLSANSGSKNATVEITCTRNPSSTDERSAVLTVISASGKIKKPVTVIQSIANETLTTNTTELSFISDGESKTLAIQSNSVWTIKGAEDWFTLSRTEGEGNADVTVTAKKNEQETVRNAILTIQGSNASVRVTITQDGHVTTLSVSPSVINASAQEGTYELVLDGDAKWNASVNVDWCSLNKLSGVGSERILVSVKENTTSSSRDAVITITTNKGDKTCEVQQVGGNAPSVTGFSVSDIQRYSFKASASYTSAYEVTEYGICYSETSTAPSVNDKVVKKTGSSKSGNMSFTIEGLQSGKTYYVRAYAKSVIGTSYSEVKTVKTAGSSPNSGDNVTPQV